MSPLNEDRLLVKSRSTQLQDGDTSCSNVRVLLDLTNIELTLQLRILSGVCEGSWRQHEED